MSFKEGLEEVISREQVADKVSELAQKIEKDFKNKNFVALSILKGSFIFTADLVRAIKLPLEVSFMSVSSYGEAQTSSGSLKVRYDVDISVKGRDVLIVEDIIDSGITLSYLKKYLLDLGASSVKICAFLDKKARRKVDIKPDYVGFDVDDVFIVGYGLDSAEKYRNLAGIYKVLEN